MPLLVDVRQLTVINELIDEGANNVATSFTELSDTETEVEIQSLTFVDPVDLPNEIGDEETYVASIQLTEPPYGVFILTFTRETAESVATLVSGVPVTGELTTFQQSALQETCNIVTSGFIDGIANTLNTTIDMGTPQLTQGGGDAVQERLSHVHGEAVAIVLDSVVTAPALETSLELSAYLVPSPGSFVNLIDCLDADEFSTTGPDGSEATS